MRYPARFRRVPALHRMLAPIALVVWACVLGVPTADAGPMGPTVFGGWYTDGTDDAMLGAGLRIGAAAITIIPNGEYIFVDRGTYYTLNLDATLTVLPLGVASAFVGGGIGFATIDPEVGDSNTETVGNVIVGAGFNAVPLKPYAQLKLVVQDGDDPLVFSIGARF